MLLKTTIQAGAMLEFYEAADFFRMLEAADPVTVRFYLDGKEVAEAGDVRGGYAERFGGGFNRFTVSSATTQTVQFVARLGNQVQYDIAPTGEVTVAGYGPGAAAGAFNQAQATVTNVSGQLLPANPARRYLMVQNKALTGDIYVNVTGTAATAANGVLVVPGAALELAGYVPDGAITAVGTVASNTSVVVVEG